MKYFVTWGPGICLLFNFSYINGWVFFPQILPPESWDWTEWAGNREKGERVHPNSKTQFEIESLFGLFDSRGHLKCWANLGSGLLSELRTWSTFLSCLAHFKIPNRAPPPSTQNNIDHCYFRTPGPPTQCYYFNRSHLCFWIIVPSQWVSKK